ncbi:MAG: rod shape-determining protein MreC [Syntrophotaleaceae bacterium]
MPILDLLRKYRTHLVVAVLILAALVLYSSNLRQRSQTTLFERTLLQLTAPLMKGYDTLAQGMDRIWSRYLWLVETEQENIRLRQENMQLKGALAGLEEVRLSNERLRKLLDFREETGLAAVPAQIIAVDASSWFRTVIISKGTQDGLAEGQPVVVAEGVVGRIIKSSSQQSRVMLITDASSAVASLVQRSRTRAICRGDGTGLVLEFAQRQDDVEIGDQVITSGTGGIFPKGLVLGRATAVSRGNYGLFQTVEVTPAVDFSRLEEVLVLTREEL